MSHPSSICAFALAGALLATPSAAQVVDFGKYPNFKGQWVRTGNPNNWIALAGPPPLTPEYQKVFEETQADPRGRRTRQLAVDLLHPGGHAGDDELLRSDGDDRDAGDHLHPDQPQRQLLSTDLHGRPRLAGRCPAHFRGLLDRQVDRPGRRTAGTTCSRSRRVSSRARAVTIPRACRFTATTRPSSRSKSHLDKADRDTLYDEITVIDHAMTRPYSKIQKATRNPDPRPLWLSDVCSENNTHVRIGTEHYFLSADGKLMPSKKNQAPPDLSYFKQAR